MKHALVASLYLLLFLAPNLNGNDSAASTAGGGIQLIKESRISITKERLAISEERVTVEYEFFNETDQPISTEVAFPVPPYKLLVEDPGGPRSFDDFRVWVEGKELNYQTEVRGKLLNGSDCSAVLRRFGIDIASFGHFNPVTRISADYIKLSDSQKEELKDAGFFTPNPAWTVQKMYHWRQVFPARKTIHVRHEYAPVYGFSWIGAEALEEKMSDACVDPTMQRRLAQSLTKDVYMMWVDYILTTANNWKTPIKDFELLVERPKGDTKRRSRFHTWYVSFCWDGAVSEIDSDHFLAKKVNFAPKRELRVFFFGVQ